MLPWSKMPAMEDDYYFVWVIDRSGKACPQIWAGDQFDRPDWQLNHVISKRLLNATERTMCEILHVEVDRLQTKQIRLSMNKLSFARWFVPRCGLP